MSAAKKVAEVAGLISEDQPEVEDGNSIPQITKQTDKTVALTQVGNVRYTYFNPMDDKTLLENLFGVMHDKKKSVHYLSCPDCNHHDMVDVGTFEDDEEISCSECGYEGDFENFDDGEYEVWEVSRKYTFKEVDFVVNGYWPHTALVYYAALLGKPDALASNDDYEFSGQYNDGVPMYRGTLHSWDQRCPEWSHLRGKIKPLSDMPTDDEEAF
jgi:Zn ribbon nucleic-acid-binding protein